MLQYKSIFESENLKEESFQKIYFKSYPELIDILQKFQIIQKLLDVTLYTPYGIRSYIDNSMVFYKSDTVYFKHSKSYMSFSRNDFKQGIFEQLDSGDMKLTINLKDKTLIVAIF